jgi:hypothetical protein
MFAMGFFNWVDPDKPVVSGWLWLYFLFSAVLTAVTVTIYLWWTRKNQRRFDGFKAMV